MDQNQSRFYILESLLNDILSLIKPLENDHYQRQYTIYQINNIAQSVASLKDVVIRPFGSFVSNLYTKWGDLDTSLELSHVAPNSTVKKRKQNLLREMMRALRKYGIASSFTFVPQARVPVLKFQTNLHNISCDVSVDNHMGWMKSKILKQISEIDERFRDVVLLTKEWAKAQDINDPKTGTLNSYSLCLLVVFHFQTCSPAILPPLKDIYDGNFVDATGPWSSIEMRIESACAANIARFKIHRQRNHSTLCELLVSFFKKFSNLESISSDTVISTYMGQWQNMRNNPRWMDKSHILLVEDPFERPDNAARAVSFKGLGTISDAFMTTFQDLSSDRVLSDRNLMLDVLLRSNINSPLKAKMNLYSASRNHQRPHVERNGYALSNVHHNRYQNNQKSKISHNTHATSGAGTSNHYATTTNHKLPDIGFSGYIEVGDDPRVQNNVIPNIGFSGYRDVGDDHRRVRNNVIRNSVPNNYTANHNTAYQTPNNVHSGYSIGSHASYTNQNRSNVRSQTAPTHYAVSAYADDDNQSRNYNNSRYAHSAYVGEIKADIQPSVNLHRHNGVAAAGDMRNQTSTSRASQPHYNYAAGQEQPVWKPKTLR